MKNPIKMDDLGVPLVFETSIYFLKHPSAERSDFVFPSKGSKVPSQWKNKVAKVGWIVSGYPPWN